MSIGVLHPGQMGSYLAATLKRSGHDVAWCSAGRSSATGTRATEIGLREIPDLGTLAREVEVLFGVCPPHAAEAVLQQVLDAGFQGHFVDANAIAPQRSRLLAQRMAEQGGRYTDGGIVGGPDWKGETTCLYLSGPDCEQIAALFKRGPLQVKELNPEIGAASALKMCYAAYTKGSTALLATILAAAEAYKVRPDLESQWASDWPEFDQQARNRTRRVTAKAWRFAGEMAEISNAFKAAGLPGDFHAGAEEIYRRMSSFKGAESPPELLDVLHALIAESGKESAK